MSFAYTAPFGRDVNYLGTPDTDIHPNRADYLFVLIRRYRERGMDFESALRLARAENTAEE